MDDKFDAKSYGDRIKYFLENEDEIVAKKEKIFYDILENDKIPTYKEMKNLLEISNDFLSYIKNSFENIKIREAIIKKFTFALPFLEILEYIKKFEPILEIGAGSGYWACLLKKIGCDIIATTIDDQLHPYPKKYTDIEYLTAIEASKKYPDRTVLMCWPSMANWPVKALPYINRLIYIGEWGGCTGNDKFFDILKKNFKTIESSNILSWPLIRDCIYRLEKTSEISKEDKNIIEKYEDDTYNVEIDFLDEDEKIFLKTIDNKN